MIKNPDPAELALYVGDWVAVQDGEIILADNTPENLLESLRERGLTADMMFRVPLPEELERHR